MGIAGPQLYQSKFGPTYRVSYGTSIGLLVACQASILGTWWLVLRGDRLRAEAKVDGGVSGAVSDASRSSHVSEEDVVVGGKV